MTNQGLHCIFNVEIETKGIKMMIAAALLFLSGIGILIVKFKRLAKKNVRLNKLLRKANIQNNKMYEYLNGLRDQVAEGMLK